MSLSLCLAVGMVAGTSWLMAEAPAPPAVSKFAPAKDVENAIYEYVMSLDSALSVEAADYSEAKQTTVKKSAGALAALTLLAANHDSDLKLKGAAPAILEAAQQLGKTSTDQAKAKEHLAAIKKAVAGDAAAGNGKPIDWDKVADLETLMKQVSTLNSRLKRGVKGSKLERYADRTANYSVTLAAIAQAGLVDTSAVEKPEDAAKWYQFSAEFRDAAGEVNAAIHKQEAEAVSAALVKLKKSCDDCHAVFEEDQL